MPLLLFAEQACDIAAVFFGGSACAFVAEDFGVFTLFAGGLIFGFGCLVFEVVGEEGSANAFLGEPDDVECSGECFGARDDGVANTDLGGWLGDGAVVANRGAATGFGGIAACFIHARAPEPFV